MRRVLIATEGSTISAEAVREFARIFGPGFASLTVLAVIPPAARPDGHPQAAAHYHQEAEACQEALDLAIADLELAGHEASGAMRVGPVAETIVGFANEWGADLIVLGTHDRKGLDRFLQGSVAERVLHEAPCAVFIYPYPARARAMGATPAGR
jgi:nucleotide-binding universal stress UspA family protein